MKRLVPFGLLIASGICLLIGCVKRSEPRLNTNPDKQPVVVLPKPEAKPEPKVEPKPEPAPVVEVEDPVARWLAVSPMKTKMRSMWVSCGEINAMASGAFGFVDFDTLESNATNIARKAKEFADMWQAVRDSNREMAAKAKAGEWFESRFQSQRLWKSCTDCHVENWSLETRGFMPQTIKGWVDHGNPIERVQYGNLKLNSPPHYLESMYRMVSYFDRAVRAIEGNDTKVVLDSAKSLHELANEQYELWRGVERHANKIVETAATSKVDEIDLSYAKMIENCNSCHEKYVQDERAPLNPLPWKYPR